MFRFFSHCAKLLSLLSYELHLDIPSFCSPIERPCVFNLSCIAILSSLPLLAFIFRFYNFSPNKGHSFYLSISSASFCSLVVGVGNAIIKDCHRFIHRRCFFSWQSNLSQLIYISIPTSSHPYPLCSHLRLLVPVSFSIRFHLVSRYRTHLPYVLFSRNPHSSLSVLNLLSSS